MPEKTTTQYINRDQYGHVVAAAADVIARINAYRPVIETKPKPGNCQAYDISGCSAVLTRSILSAFHMDQGSRAHRKHWQVPTLLSGTLL
jgi:hypothetical protein